MNTNTQNNLSNKLYPNIENANPQSPAGDSSFPQRSLGFSDTIAAAATPTGGGIAVVRISGPHCADIITKVFRPAGSTGAENTLKSHKLVYGHAYHCDVRIDECMAVFMAAPRTYTREDVAELHCHGGAFVVAQVLQALIKAGARAAEPGEFTKRAYLSGRIDLTRAEAVMDIIGAEGEAAARQALHQLRGGLSSLVEGWLEGLTDIRAEVEAALDFPEEDLVFDTETMLKNINILATQLKQQLEGVQGARLAREGVRVVLAGRPNAGKSSLYNALLGCDRAIVTDIPGTTRDTLEETLIYEGVKLILVDSAGLSDHTDDPVEALGMARANEAIVNADVVLWCVDCTGEAHYPKPEQNHIIILTKIDLLLKDSLDSACGRNDGEVFPVSAKTGVGLQELLQKLQALATPRTQETGLLTNARHAEVVTRARAALIAAAQAIETGLAPDAWCDDLTYAHDALCEITGENATDALIDAIFSRFCLGK